MFPFRGTFTNLGLKGGISIDADSGPPRLWWYFSRRLHFYSDLLWPYYVLQQLQIKKRKEK